MRLSSIQNSNKSYVLFDFSRIATLANAVGLDIEALEHQDHLAKVTRTMMKYLSPEVSGVVVDPDFDFDLITHKLNGTGLLLSLEKKATGIDPLTLPKLADNWGIEHIANNYALAKLELYYHPQEPEAMRKRQFVAEVYDYCKYEGIDLLLELMVYHSTQENLTPEILLETQLQSAQELSSSTDIFALEYLGSALSAVTLTAELDTPWIYNAREVDYGSFKENLRVCIDSGAQGFMAGDPFWLDDRSRQVLSSLDTETELENLIKTEMRDKVIEAVRIAGERV